LLTVFGEPRWLGLRQGKVGLSGSDQLTAGENLGLAGCQYLKPLRDSERIWFFVKNENVII
jgi:hypothetical protein